VNSGQWAVNSGQWIVDSLLMLVVKAVLAALPE